MKKMSLDSWEQFAEELERLAPDASEFPSLYKLKQVTHCIETDKKNGVDSNASRKAHLANADLRLFRGSGKPSLSELELRIRIQKSQTYQDIMLVMLDEIGISITETTVQSVLNSEITFADASKVARATMRELVSKPENSLESAVTASDLLIADHKTMKNDRNGNTTASLERVGMLVGRVVKDNDYYKLSGQIVLSVHFHSYVRQKQ